MNSIKVSKESGITMVTMSRGKVNAVNEAFVDELGAVFNDLASDADTKAVILTGDGKFFSFGFDIPELLNYPKNDFTRYLKKFSSMYTQMFLFQKPVIGAINGHATAGGCILALTCDFRIMVTGKAKIALNELNIGAAVFAGSVGMLKSAVGERNAEKVLLTGAMYTAEDAQRIGLVDSVTSEEKLMAEAKRIAEGFSQKNPDAFKTLKNLLRRPAADCFGRSEEDSILDFIEIWYSEPTQEVLKGVVINK
ncbi:MAG: enoyl-CoA hydratase/isomerase family protein [Proteobacteria bacterium]|nr:enoyl-CoA hydratase/isomerase family protein [Pseudomonadota bacterium]